MQQQPSETTDNTLEWFTENLPPEYLQHPEYFLYSTALDVQRLQDIPENRRRFKQLLIERQLGEGIELPEIDQKQLHDFMNPDDKELRFKRAKELVQLVDRGLNEMHDFEKAQRSAILELFHRETPFMQVEMDEAYFRNPEFVEADLGEALKCAEGDCFADLHTLNPKRNTLIKTQNGEQVKWNTYLLRASGVLFDTKSRSDNPHRLSDALKILLKMTGVDVPLAMDKEYFNNPEFVKADLTAFLQHAKGDSLKDLRSNNPKVNVSILTKSNEQVTWRTYLNRASGVLLGTEKRGDNSPHRPLDALKILLKMTSVDVPLAMDEKYFNDPETVKADLIAYLQHAKGDSLKDLNSNNPKPPTAILTQNGEQVKWNTYLKRASGVILGTTQSKKDGDSHRLSDALKYLKELCGVIIMDKSYFHNIKYVKADLTAYSHHTKGKSIVNLTVTKPALNISITTQSGETITWEVYLSRASAFLLGTTGNRKSKDYHRYDDALKYLKELCGVIPMDERYFRNPKYVKADLNAYLDQAAGDSLVDLSTINPTSNTIITTQSGEQVIWRTYLNRASAVLFGTKLGSENPHRRPKALSYLKELCGVIPTDERYFRNPKYVKADLATALKQAKGDSLADLTTFNPLWKTLIRTQNGEQVTWITYLNRASRILLGTKAGGDNPNRPSKVLKKLIEIAEQAEA